MCAIIRTLPLYAKFHSFLVLLGSDVTANFEHKKSSYGSSIYFDNADLRYQSAIRYSR